MLVAARECVYPNWESRRCEDGWSGYSPIQCSHTPHKHPQLATHSGGRAGLGGLVGVGGMGEEEQFRIGGRWDVQSRCLGSERRLEVCRHRSKDKPPAVKPPLPVGFR